MILLGKNIGLYADIYRFLSNLVDDGDHYAVHFDMSLDDLDLRSRSQLYEKSKILVSIFLQI